MMAQSVHILVIVLAAVGNVLVAGALNEMRFAMSEIIIADGPARTNVPGQWRISLSETPSAAWRDRLLELATADPVTAALRIEVEGASLFFMSGNTTREVLSALRALYKLFRDANRPLR